MQSDEIRRHSRWLMRIMEWDDGRARYPNLWHDGMPRHVLAYDRVVSRLRLGDLIAVFYPTSQKHPRRSERFLGISRVVGLRSQSGGEGGIRTPGTGISPYNRLAICPVQPLQHLSARGPSRARVREEGSGRED